MRFSAIRVVILSILISTVGSGSVLTQNTPVSNEPLYPIFEDGHWGLIDTSGKVVLPAHFQMVSRYPSGWNPAGLTDPVSASIDITGAEPITDRIIPIRLDGKAGFATRDGRIVALGRYDETWWRFDEGLIRVKSGGSYGFADERGELVIPARFDLAWSFNDGYAFVRSDDLWGVIDRDGNMVVPPTWDQLDSPGMGLKKVSVRKGNRWGVVDRSGKLLIPLRFEKIIRPTGSLVSVVDSGRTFYVKPDGKVAFELKCAKKLFRRPEPRGFPFFGRSAIVRCGDRYGLIGLQGNYLLEPVWDDIGPFFEDRAIVKSGSKQGIIDPEGRFILEPVDIDIGTYHEGLATFSGYGPDGDQSGYLDLEGKVVIKGSFEKFLYFNQGRAVVRRAGKDGYIDRSGSWVVEPRYWRANPFRGPLATAEQPLGKDMKEVSYIDLKGKVVYRLRFKGFINY